jgi:hypothetical protein
MGVLSQLCVVLITITVLVEGRMLPHYHGSGRTAAERAAMNGLSAPRPYPTDQMPSHPPHDPHRMPLCKLSNFVRLHWPLTNRVCVSLP